MQVETIQYTTKEGWSIKEFPKLDSDQTLILVFAAPEFLNNPEPIKELSRQYPQSKMLGCSTAGEIAGPRILDNSLSVAILRFEKTQIQTSKVEIKSPSDSFQVGQQIVKNLNRKDMRGLFVLAGGMKVNGSELAHGLNSLTRKDVVVTGGIAGDGDRFKQAWSIFDGEICENYITAVSFYGDAIEIGFASRGGWDIFGPERRVTRSKDNILYELDDKPALNLYKEYLGDRASGLPATGLLFPLAIRSGKENDRQLVRTILGVNEDEQSLTFAGDIPIGYYAQLMRANFDRLTESACEAGQVSLLKMIKTQTDTTSSPLLNIAISCVGRRLLLGERTEYETEGVFEAFPKGIKQVGFYSYGELSPHTTGECDLHNQTMTLTTISEKMN